MKLALQSGFKNIEMLTTALIDDMLCKVKVFFVLRQIVKQNERLQNGRGIESLPMRGGLRDGKLAVSLVPDFFGYIIRVLAQNGKNFI